MRVIWDPKAKEARTKVANYIRLVSEDILYIAGFWDTRMDDEEQAASVK